MVGLFFYISSWVESCLWVINNLENARAGKCPWGIAIIVPVSNTP